ncbi:Uncharacterised protein [Yersinia enterocolitica]|nr:Uncharacterised protein [Yersinia enterocolitica]
MLCLIIFSAKKLATLTISVVSFYNIDAEDNEECDTMFDKAARSTESYCFRSTLSLQHIS